MGRGELEISRHIHPRLKKKQHSKETHIYTHAHTQAHMHVHTCSHTHAHTFKHAHIPHTHRKQKEYIEKNTTRIITL